MKKIAPKKVAQKNAARKRTASPTKASTIRLQPELQSALNKISNHLDRPKNKLVNQAVAEFLERTTSRLQGDLQDTLQKLHAYRDKDPSFEADIERFASAESSHAAQDAHEGDFQADSGQSLSKEIQELIHA